MKNRIKEKCKIITKHIIKYTTDGCTLAPDFNFKDCCEEHDQDYAENYRTSERNRAKADKKLRLCIKCRGWKYLCWVYWAFVRIFGWIPFWILPRRKSVKENK